MPLSRDVRNNELASLSNLSLQKENVKGITSTGKKGQLYSILGLKPVLQTANMLTENYNCYIGTVPDTMQLLLSDNPAAGVILGFNDICIPLCGNIAVIFRVNQPNAKLISSDLPINNKIELSEHSVFQYNLIQLSYANRYMFGDKQSLISLKRIIDKNGGYSTMFKK